MENEGILQAAPNDDLGYPASVQLSDGSIVTVYYQADRAGEKTWPDVHQVAAVMRGVPARVIKRSNEGADAAGSQGARRDVPGVNGERRQRGEPG